ncbi:hypothetical protein ACHAWO_013124 [Cyclotella atomus]|uniref:HSF-type DNA-binding domain-containing protein n=1 Tax=Cyclotella atomus TaxID=382360 RepID=A0ABD3MZ10_9STRA
MLVGRQSRYSDRVKVPSTIINHKYSDYSAVDVSELLEEESEEDDTSVMPGQAHGHGVGTPICTNRVTFPMRLHMILSDPQHRNVVRWMPHGRSWKVFDEKGLEKLCGEYFYGETFDDFIRSVNRWGFKELVGRGPDYESYYHQYFLRGKPDLCKLMDTTINTGELIPDIVNEPNLYVISKLYPLPEDPAHAQTCCVPREQVLCPNCRVPLVPTIVNHHHYYSEMHPFASPAGNARPFHQAPTYALAEQYPANQNQTAQGRNLCNAVHACLAKSILSLKSLSLSGQEELPCKSNGGVFKTEEDEEGNVKDSMDCKPAAFGSDANQKPNADATAREDDQDQEWVESIDLFRRDVFTNEAKGATDTSVATLNQFNGQADQDASAQASSDHYDQN